MLTTLCFIILPPLDEVIAGYMLDPIVIGAREENLLIVF